MSKRPKFIKKELKESFNEPASTSLLSDEKVKQKKITVTKSETLFFLFGLISSSVFFALFHLSLSYSTSKDETLLYENDKIKINNTNNKHKLAIVVPYRDRFDELTVFVPHMSKFLSLKSIDFKIYIINQVDKFRFNRASLINVGFLASKYECDYMAMHDVDLLPLNDMNNYEYPNLGPYHVSSSGLHPEYNYSTFIGGILIVNKQNFLTTNGMSNRYWGWGREDDELYLRFSYFNLTVQRPDITKFKTNHRFTFFHNHDASVRQRDKIKLGKQRQESLKMDITGLNNIQYRIRRNYQMKIEGYPCSIIDVELFCDRFTTPWCSADYQFYDD